jgi:hypothetical protein
MRSTLLPMTKKPPPIAKVRLVAIGKIETLTAIVRILTVMKPEHKKAISEIEKAILEISPRIMVRR